tara:strand:+ start:171 stop:479 length:309 start_codon:yes stop_codon:yes gene_type:complete
MPTYRFYDSITCEEYDEFMPMAELDNYKKLNPHIHQVPVAVAIAGDHIMGAGPKVDNGFTENMQRIAESHPGTPLADKYGTSSTKTTKEIKTREVLKKHGVL